MKPAPAFDCADCGRRIGKTRTHLLLTDGRVVCIRHHAAYHDAGQVKSWATRAAAANLLGLWP